MSWGTVKPELVKNFTLEINQENKMRYAANNKCSNCLIYRHKIENLIHSHPYKK